MAAQDEPLAAARARAARDIADLEVELAALADPDVVALDDEHDAEGSTVGYERARVAGLLGRARTRVADLDDAAARAAAGVADRCEACGGPIGAERLSALPATRRCVGCARR